MKKYTWVIIIILFTALWANVFGQTTTTRPFEVKKSGQGKQAIIFIPGLGCSGEVWNETVEKFEKNYTCYTLTMAGFAGAQPNNCLRQIEKDKRVPKAALPDDLKEEKQPSIEPQIRLLYQCIAELPETDRIIISLELEDVKQAEIASITGLSEANIRVKIHRIKEKLSQKFKAHAHEQ